MLLVSIGLTLIQSKLSILSPTVLQSKFINGTVKASYANFGYIPYGHSIIGRLYFNESNPNACEDLPHQNFTVDADGDITPFWIAERGGCSFVKKVRNLENIGVAVVIIVDATEEDVEHIVMSDDGTGGGIRIPSMLIGKTDGRKLIDFVKKGSQQELDQIAILAEF